MPPALPNDQELSLKKRARRRLVGAIALVLLMVIALPMILQDRASLAQQDAIKITMPEMPAAVVDTNANQPAFIAPAETIQALETPTVADEPNAPNITSDEAAASNKASNIKSEAEQKKVENKNLVANVEKKAEAKEKVTKSVDEKVVESKSAAPAEAQVESRAQQKNNGSFAIQVGVYSDAANVKQLQAKLKEAGYTSHTEKITTAKGEKIRLRAGNYPSRQEAADALVKLQGSGLSGMVISNE
jgi:DedD protein